MLSGRKIADIRDARIILIRPVLAKEVEYGALWLGEEEVEYSLRGLCVLVTPFLNYTHVASVW